MKTMLLLMILLLTCGAAQAGIQWTWTNAGTGTEQGTFVTDGELVLGEAPAGTYTVVDFSVTASAYGLPIGAVSEGAYSIGQPTVGFVWSGTAPTNFWRSSGGLTNGFTFWDDDAVEDAPNRVGFIVDWFVVDEYYGISFVDESSTAVITPMASATPNEARTFGGVKSLFR
jgi:hypothetical protein